MKKLLLAFILLFSTMCTWAYSFKSDVLFYKITSATEPYTVAVTYDNVGWTSYSKYIVVPSTVSYNGLTYTVSSVDSAAFRKCTDLASVVLPTTITKIGAEAFYGCSALSYFNMPASVESIGNSAFGLCTSLTSITIPSGVKVIGKEAFYASGLYSITIPTGVTDIKLNTFASCSQLGSVSLPETVSFIDPSAFNNCKNLSNITVSSKNINYLSVNNVLYNKDKTKILFFPKGYTGEYIIPSTITSIDAYQFYGCYKITSVTIPNSITSIGNYAFSGCNGLTSIVVPPSVKTIGNNVFEGCAFLASVTLPMNLKEISSYAFANCDALTSIVLPDSLVIINPSMFAGCNKLNSVTLPYNLTTIHYAAFSECPVLSNISLPPHLSMISSMAFYKSAIYKFKFPAITNIIYDGIFSSCTGLNSVTIPEGVTTIKGGVFGSCYNLNSLYVNVISPVDLSSSYSVFGSVPTSFCKLYVPVGSKNAYATANQWSSFTNIIEVDTLKTLNVTAGSLSTILTTEETQMLKRLNLTGSLDARDLYFIKTNMYSLKYLDMRNVNIEAYSGSFDTTLFRSASISKTFAANTLPIASFKDMVTLRSIVLPASLTGIQDKVFSGCVNLDSIQVINPSPIDLSSTVGVFDGVNKSTCVLEVPQGTIPVYRSATQWQDFLTVNETGTTTALQFADNKMFKVNIQNHKAVITGLEAGTDIAIYNLQGIAIYQQVAQAESVRVALPSTGMYVLKVGEQTMKIMY